MIGSLVSRPGDCIEASRKLSSAQLTALQASHETAGRVSKVISLYLNALCPDAQILHDAANPTLAAPFALEDMLIPEIDEFIKHLGADDIFPSFLLRLGAEFGICAATAVLQSKSADALEVIAMLRDDVKENLRHRIDDAVRKADNAA